MTAPAADDNARRSYDRVLVDITTYVYRHEITSANAWFRAKTTFLDALGCVLETLKESAEARAMVGPLIPGSVVPNGARIPGTPYQLDPLKAAFDLGALIRYLDHNDAYPGAEWGHPSDNIGAVLSIADWLSREAKAAGRDVAAHQPPLTIRTVLLGLIKAYEIQGCFQIRNAFNKVGLDHTILVKAASTAVVSWLLGLSQTQATDALSQAWMDGGALRAFRQSPNTGPRKGWAAGDACMRAVQFALLTQRGQPGAPTVLTTPRWGFYDALFRGRAFELPRPLGSWVVENVLFKIRTAEGHGTSGVEAAVGVARALAAAGRSVADIARIRCRTQQPAITIINKRGPLHNPADRDHCMRYMVAVTLLKGDWVATADYQDDSPWAADPRVDRLRDAIELVEDPQMTADYHDPAKRSVANALLVTLADGSVLPEVLVEYPLGHAKRDETLPLAHEKFRNNLQAFFGKPQADDILAASESEGFLDMPVCEFVDKFVVQP